MNTNQVMLRASLLVKSLAPKLSGNLAFNSIRAFRTPRGFRIVQLGNAAPYGSIINRGRRDRILVGKEKTNVGWWERARGSVMKFMNTKLNLDKKTYQSVARQSKNNPLREKTFARSIPKV